MLVTVGFLPILFKEQTLIDICANILQNGWYFFLEQFVRVCPNAIEFYRKKTRQR